MLIDVDNDIRYCSFSISIEFEFRQDPVAIVWVAVTGTDGSNGRSGCNVWMDGVLVLLGHAW